ncbi:MAG: TMEM175 family protein [Pseudolysinimonas sp.]
MDESIVSSGPADETVVARQHRLFSRGRDTSRMEYFSDAVFAIAMTLLVLDIKLPQVEPGKLWVAIGDLWPQFFAYALSFAVLGLNWIFHHRKFRVIRSFDGGLMWINLLFLAFVAILPFPTSVLSEYGSNGHAGVVLYAFEVGMLGALQTWLWWYAYRRGHLDPQITPRLAIYIARANFAPTVFFWLSIPVFLWVPSPLGNYAGYVLWALTWPLGSIVDRWGAKRRAAP